MKQDRAQALRRNAPAVAVTACRRFDATQFQHGVGEKYLRALTQAAGVTPLVVPALGADCAAAALAAVDGVFLTGSPSNVEPARYGDTATTEMALDVERDATAFALIEGALARGLPLFAVCRGLQELNVALGGSLDPHLHLTPGRHDHREPRSREMSVRYAAAHPVSVREGGVLARLVGAGEIVVNSLHEQGIRRLCEGAAIEATAADGLVEAFSLPSARSWVLAVQWHPEWQASLNPVSAALFAGFGDACRSHAHRRARAPRSEEELT